MNCPRCETALKAVTIEDSQVHACPNCDGTWYPDEALGEVTDFTFSELKETELSPSLVPDKLARVDLDKAICCPQCGKEMARYTYSMTCRIELDECSEHGVWLDDGELGTLMQYLTELDKRVSAKEASLATSRNFETLAELSRSPSYYSLPTNVLATLNSLYNRDR